MSISFQEYSQYVLGRLLDFESLSNEEISARLQEVLAYGSANYGELDEESKWRADVLLRGFLAHARASLSAKPDSPEKRQAIRELAYVDDEHYKIGDLLKNLAGEPPQTERFVLDAQEKCVTILQMAADLFFDSAMAGPTSGHAAFAVMALLAESMNNAIGALHLVKHGLTNQAVSLIRNIHESLTLVRLFAEQPQWAELWLTGSENDIWKELRPKKAREKLGDKGKDEIYGMFSSIAHPSFKAVQRMGYTEKGQTEQNKLVFRIGGAPFVQTVMFTYAWLMHMCVRVLFEVQKTQTSRLNIDECNQMTRRSVALMRDFLTAHFLPMAREAGYDVSGLEGLIQRFFGSDDAGGSAESVSRPKDG